jgi:hypothetical protein
LSPIKITHAKAQRRKGRNYCGATIACKGKRFSSIDGGRVSDGVFMRLSSEPFLMNYSTAFDWSTSSQKSIQILFIFPGIAP